MHSHDRTLLSKLGFADPDKKNPEHDRACLYLSQPDTAAKVSSWVCGRWIREEEDWGVYKAVGVQIAEAGSTAMNEVHLFKGEGKYATTIGFLDVVISHQCVKTGTATHRWGSVQRPHPQFAGSFQSVEAYLEIERHELKQKNVRWKTFVEVKIGHVPFGEILRQLNLYKAHFKANQDYSFGQGVPTGLPVGILVAPWDLAGPEIQELEKASFAFLKLGQGYRDWVASLSKPAPADEV